jgi:hypothetical protein
MARQRPTLGHVHKNAVESRQSWSLIYAHADSLAAFKFVYKSPLSGPKRYTNAKQRTLGAYKPLRTVPEEPQKPGFIYKIFDNDHSRQHQDEAEYHDGNDDDLFEWEEETTLVAALLQDECV